MPRNSAARSPRSLPNCSAKRMAPRRLRPHPGAGCIPNPFRMILRGNAMTPSCMARRHFLGSATGLCVSAFARTARAQFVPPPDRAVAADDLSAGSRQGVEVKARPIPWFDRQDHERVRFGALEYRSGLVLTSSFSKFGGLSGLRLDARGERFISFSDHGHWFTGRIVYEGRKMKGLADVESAPMLGPDGRPIMTRGWFDSESIAIDG